MIHKSPTQPADRIDFVGQLFNYSKIYTKLINFGLLVVINLFAVICICNISRASYDLAHTRRTIAKRFERCSIVRPHGNCCLLRKLIDELCDKRQGESCHCCTKPCAHSHAVKDQEYRSLHAILAVISLQNAKTIGNNTATWKPHRDDSACQITL